MRYCMNVAWKLLRRPRYRPRYILVPQLVAGLLLHHPSTEAVKPIVLHVEHLGTNAHADGVVLAGIEIHRNLHTW